MPKKSVKIENAESNVDKVYQIFYKSNIIQPLKSFCVIVEEDCSINKAASVLLLTPTTLSKQIKSLEEKLNIKLFKSTESRKDGKYIELTEDGEEFYKKAKPQVEAIDNLLGEYIEEKKGKENNLLRIGSNSFILKEEIPYLSNFTRTKKDTQVKIDFFNREAAFELLQNNKLDIFISSIEDDEKVLPKLKFIELKKYKPMLVLYKGHPLENKSSNKITVQDILKNDFIFNDFVISMVSLKKFIKNNNIKTKVDYGKFNLDMTKVFIRNKMSIWIIFDIFLTDEDKKEFVIKDLTNHFPNGSYGIFVNKNFSYKKVVKEYIEFVLNKKDRKEYNN